MKTKKIMIALMLLTTGTAWAEDFPKDSLKIVDIEEVVVIATPKENRKLRDLPVAATVLSQDNMRANHQGHCAPHGNHSVQGAVRHDRT